MADDKKEASFLNPFDKGFSYVDFKKALGNKTVAEYCKGKLTSEEIAYLENELSLLKEK